MSIILLTGCAPGNSHQNTKLPYQVIPSTGANYSLPNSTKPSSNLKDSNPSSNYSPAFNYLSPKSDYSSIPPRSTSSSHSNASESPSLPTNIAKPYEYTVPASNYTSPVSGGNCHSVRGYYRKNGTYVRGHTRCR